MITFSGFILHDKRQRPIILGTKGIKSITKDVEGSSNGARHLKKGRSLLCERTAVRYQFIQSEEKAYPIRILCQVRAVSVSPYYDWRRMSKADVVTLDSVGLESSTKALFAESNHSIGSRKLSRKLKQEGFQVGRHKARK